MICDLNDCAVKKYSKRIYIRLRTDSSLYDPELVLNKLNAMYSRWEYEVSKLSLFKKLFQMKKIAEIQKEELYSYLEENCILYDNCR